MAHALRATEKVNSVNDDEELRHRGYVVGPTLGEGSYAKVKSAFAAKLNKKVALKIINRRKAPKDFQQKFLPRELEIMQLIHHPHIIELFEVMQFNGKVNPQKASTERKFIAIHLILKRNLLSNWQSIYADVS